MKKIKILIIFLIIIIAFKNNFAQIIVINADSLISKSENFIDKRVETVGFIVHICGVDYKKMKLKTENGQIIQIVLKDSLACFDKIYYKKKVKILGIVKEFRIEKDYVDKIEVEKILLCHIDYSPCKDSLWVNQQKKAGNVDVLSKQSIEKMRKNMEQTGKPFISILTIVAEKIEIIE